MYRHDPAATNLGRILFGLGCLSVTLLISGAFYAYTAAALQAWIAVIPALFGWMYVKAPFPPHPVPHHPAVNQIFAEMRSPVAVLLALLLFFQLGNEWAIAGWLPLFLIQRLGISPASSLLMLALYWLALLVGRVVAQWILPRVRRARALVRLPPRRHLGCVICSPIIALGPSAASCWARPSRRFTPCWWKKSATAFRLFIPQLSRVFRSYRGGLARSPCWDILRHNGASAW